MRTLILAVLLAASALPSQGLPSLIVLVRHAEKAATPAEDPGLSEAGQRRAQQLAEALAGAGITQILTTQWQRTRATAAPLAARLGLQPTVVATRRGADYAQELAALLRGLDGVLLVVGHSNTVSATVAALGGPALPPLCESSYGHALLLRPQDGGLIRLRYGDTDPAPAPGCL
jgi:phosphohistidine phosphatase SixA